MRPTLLHLLPVAFFAALVSCNSPGDKTKAKADPRRGAPTPASLEAFADSLVRLPRHQLESIDSAARFFTRLVPADSALADSAAVLWLRQASFVTDTVNEKLFRDTADYFNLVYENGKNAPANQKQFQAMLAANHVLLQGDGEGSAYAVLDYRWAIPILQQKTSSATDAYLDLLAAEETKPTLLDAGLAIETTELVDRVIAAENLLQKKLPHRFMDDVQQKHKFYKGVLLVGSDNSPTLEYETGKLVEEFAKGYADLMRRYPRSAAAQLVKEWQKVLAAGDKQKIEQWRTRYAPY